MPYPAKPHVTTNCVAARYQAPGERIVEFGDDRSGGLISIRRIGNGKLLVEVYRADDDVVMRGPHESETGA